MVEVLMYLGIGFLFATLIAVSVIPLIHGRAVRLTTRRIENSIPQSMAEIQADKDLQRADFAVSTRRLEITIEQLKESNTSQRAEIGKKDDIINRFKVEREAQNVELLLLKAEVGALKQQIGASDIRLNIEQDHPHELASLSTVPADSALPEEASTHLISPQVRMQHDRFPRAPLLATKYQGAGSAAELMLAQKRTVLNDQDDRGDAPLAASGLVEGAAARADDPTAEISADGRKPIGPEAMSASRSEPSIHVSPSDHFVQERPRRGIRLGTIPLITVLIGIALFLWVYHEDANKTLTTWTLAIIPPPPTSAEKVITPQSEEKATSPALSSQLEELTREVADMRNNVEQYAAKQAQLSRNAEPGRSEQETKEARLNPAPPPQPRLAPVPETPPTTIPGWIVHEVANGTAVVQGPNGTWRVARGDVLPGAGRVDSIVRWGNRWIVSTNRGLISTP
jgi:hypothetical protein